MSKFWSSTLSHKGIVVSGDNVVVEENQRQAKNLSKEKKRNVAKRSFGLTKDPRDDPRNVAFYKKNNQQQHQQQHQQQQQQQQQQHQCLQKQCVELVKDELSATVEPRNEKHPQQQQQQHQQQHQQQQTWATVAAALPSSSSSFGTSREKRTVRIDPLFEREKMPPI